MFDEDYLLSIDKLVESVQKDKSILDDIHRAIKDKRKDISNIIKNGAINIYKDSPEVLASDVPSLGHIVRLVFSVGITTTIHPLFGLFTLIADMAIKDNVDRKCIDKYISKYESEIRKVNSQIEKTKNNKKREDLEKHLKDLEEGLSNLEDKRDQLDDTDSGLVSPRMKELAADESTLIEALDMFRYNTLHLTDEQFEFLISDDDILDESKFIKNIKKAITRREKRMDKWFNDTYKDIRNKSYNEKRNDMVENNIPRVSKMIKRALGLGAAWAINPAIAALSAIVMVAVSKAGTEKTRKRLLAEINHELELVEEKIKDADANSDKEQKYELMRAKQKLQTNRDKIKRYI